MSLLQGGVLGLIGDKISYLTQKQSVIAQNVANADTPGYKAKGLEAFSSFLSREQSGDTKPMNVTNSKHIIPASLSGTNAKAKKIESFEVVPTGNSVDLEQQMMDVSETVVDYQTSLAVYQKFTAMFRTASGK